MERLKKMVSELRARTTPTTDEAVLNLAREYLQVLLLKFLFLDKAGTALSFMGGTCLRICYDLKRYSEDLDFCLDDRKAPYAFAPLMERVRIAFAQRGFTVATTVHDDKTVQKAFFRFGELASTLDLKSVRTEQKLHIKVEVDVKPIPLSPDNRESFFVNRFQEIFPIVKHDLSTLFAGKLLAIFYRPYPRGRDYYDLMWYLSRKAPLNLAYLNRGSTGMKFKHWVQVIEALRKKIAAIDPKALLHDIGRFLEDDSEIAWITHYPQLFEQLVGQYPEAP